MVHASTAPTTESPSGASTERTSDDPMLALYRQHGLPEARPVKPKETKKKKRQKRQKKMHSLPKFKEERPDLRRNVSKKKRQSLPSLRKDIRKREQRKGWEWC